MRKPRTKTRTWHDYNLVKRGAITLGSSVFATQAVAVPPVVFSYETLNFGDANTFLTGIPVSYTHLDVYKRQVPMCIVVRIQGRTRVWFK